MTTGIYIHIDGPAKVYSNEIQDGRIDVLRLVTTEGDDLNLYLGRDDATVAANALALVGVIEMIRVRALERLDAMAEEAVGAALRTVRDEASA